MSPSLLSVAEARAQIVDDLAPVSTEHVKLAEALGRVLREAAVAQVSHPPADVSAMDGYAVRAGDVEDVPKNLRVVGESAAGHPWPGHLGEGEAIRIFTGAMVPMSADTVVIQENTEAVGVTVTVKNVPRLAEHIRIMGSDFRTGDSILAAPRHLTARDVALLAAMNLPRITVSRKPRIGVLSTGDEVVMAGDVIGPGQIPSSNGPGLCAFITAHGGEVTDLGNCKDDPASLLRMAEQARHLDLLVTSGGVSVGDHDVVKGALTDAGFKAGFHKVAMRPGKPLLYGRLHDLPVLGLPGNPVSTMVCATLFLGSALEKLLGLAGSAPRTIAARLAAPLKANDSRTDHLRATLHDDGDDLLTVRLAGVQDSAMIANLARADGLLIREPFTRAAAAGDVVRVIPLN